MVLDITNTTLVRFLALVTTMVTMVDHGYHRSNDHGNDRSNHRGNLLPRILPYLMTIRCEMNHKKPSEKTYSWRKSVLPS